MSLVSGGMSSVAPKSRVVEVQSYHQAPSTFQIENQRPRKSRCLKFFSIVITLLLLAFIISTIVLLLKFGTKVGEDVVEEIIEKKEEDQSPSNPKVLKARQSRRLNWPLPSGSLHSRFKRVSIATDHGLCSEIGRDVMFENGNAIDATIAALFCVGVINPQSSGLGGGFLMTIYNVSTQRCTTVDARETAPASANSTMFSKSALDSVIGYRAIATPGELHGLWTVYTHFGSSKIPWKKLLEPSIKLAREGYPVSADLAHVLQDKEDDIMENEDMKRIFIDARTGRVYEEGDIMRRERVAELLEELAASENPVQLFYKEGIAQTIAAEIKENGGHVTVEDLASYQTQILENPLESELLSDELVMCGPTPPSSFAVTQAIIGIMAEFYRETEVDFDDPTIYHRLIEVEKFAFAQRTKLGDVTFVKNARAISRNMTKHTFAKWVASMINDTAQDLSYYSLDLTGHVPDHGTSQVSTIDHEGNAVSTTSTINQLLGSKRVSQTLGIIWNNVMDDFSMPRANYSFGFAPSPENFILPRKRPMSSQSPMVIYNKNTGKVKMVVGASGGSRIISSVAQVVIRTMLFNQTIKEAVDAPRFHNQFLPMVTEYEGSIPLPIIKHLVKLRHQNMTMITKQSSVVQALLVNEDGYIYGNSDFRRRSSTYPAGF